jgi:hypothetical protein
LAPRHFLKRGKNIMSIYKNNIARMSGVAVIAAVVGLGAGIVRYRTLRVT